MSREITWGDAVIVAQDAPAEFLPGHRGSVCGLPDSTADLDKLENASPASAGFYLVEFSDGEAIEIPGRYLSKESE